MRVVGEHEGFDLLGSDAGIGWPGVQYPHGKASCWMNAAWTGCSWSPCASPSMVQAFTCFSAHVILREERPKDPCAWADTQGSFTALRTTTTVRNRSLVGRQSTRRVRRRSGVQGAMYGKVCNARMVAWSTPSRNVVRSLVRVAQNELAHLPNAFSWPVGLSSNALLMFLIFSASAGELVD